MAADRRRGTGAWRVLTASACVAAIAAVAVSAAPAATSKTAVIIDARGDVTGPLDLRRVSLQRASDGRLRAALSFTDTLTPKALLAGSGPPGSACIRMWTAEDADPASMRPDRLACVTARSENEFRGGVYDATGAGLPQRVAGASVKITASRTSIVLRFTQTSIGRPARLRFAVESTRPGCARAACIDTVPVGGRARMFRLR
ncbi:MAG TPA: hypothetical protein VGV90_02225 [Solirubrobacteraceae bacterium]|nr:hypothetical protein [Solirubrobacteraceae bacterium]